MNFKCYSIIFDAQLSSLNIIFCSLTVVKYILPFITPPILIEALLSSQSYMSPWCNFYSSYNFNSFNYNYYSFNLIDFSPFKNLNNIYYISSSSLTHAMHLKFIFEFVVQELSVLTKYYWLLRSLLAKDIRDTLQPQNID